MAQIATKIIIQRHAALICFRIMRLHTESFAFIFEER